MSNGKWRETDRADFESILVEGPSAGLPAGGAKVCQPCGELGTYPSRRGYDAGHVNGGDFVAFSAGHARCEWSPYPAYLRYRQYRYCEVCRERLDPHVSRRTSLSWLCDDCSSRIAEFGHLAEDVLSDLAERRFAAIGSHRPHRGDGPSLDDEGGLFDVFELPPVLPPEGWHPPGLRRCEVCGELRGKTPCPRNDGSIGEIESVCWCAGPPCVQCGRIRTRRPISDYYEENSGAWLHVGHFVGFMTRCSRCRRRDEDR